VFSYDDYGAVYVTWGNTPNYVFYANKLNHHYAKDIAAVSFYTYCYNDSYRTMYTPCPRRWLINSYIYYRTACTQRSGNGLLSGLSYH
jgi:hypothetical protein